MSLASWTRTHQSCVPMGIGFHGTAVARSAAASTTEAAAAPPNLRASRRVSGPALMNRSLHWPHPMSPALPPTTARLRLVVERCPVFDRAGVESGPEVAYGPRGEVDEAGDVGDLSRSLSDRGRPAFQRDPHKGRPGELVLDPGLRHPPHRRPDARPVGESSRRRLASPARSRVSDAGTRCSSVRYR